MRAYNTFAQLVEVPTYNLVGGIVSAANSCLCRAMKAWYWEHRPESAAARAAAQESHAFYGTREQINMTGYDPIERSPSAKLFSAWIALAELAINKAHAIEAGKLIGYLMTPQQAGAWLQQPGEDRRGDVTLDDLSLKADWNAAFEVGSKKNLDRWQIQERDLYGQAAAEAELIFKTQRGAGEVDLLPTELSALLRKFEDRVNKSTINGLSTGMYGTRNNVRKEKVSDLALTQHYLRVAELEAQYLERGTEEADDEGRRY